MVGSGDRNTPERGDVPLPQETAARDIGERREEKKSDRFFSYRFIFGAKRKICVKK